MINKKGTRFYVIDNLDGDIYTCTKAHNRLYKVKWKSLEGKGAVYMKNDHILNNIKKGFWSFTGKGHVRLKRVI